MAHPTLPCTPCVTCNVYGSKLDCKVGHRFPGCWRMIDGRASRDESETERGWRVSGAVRRLGRWKVVQKRYGLERPCAACAACEVRWVDARARKAVNKYVDRRAGGEQAAL